jgi:hypothetical protein
MTDDEKQLHIRVPEKVYKKLKVRCVYEDTSMQDYVASLVADSLGEYSAEEQSETKKTSSNSKRRR